MTRNLLKLSKDKKENREQTLDRLQDALRIRFSSIRPQGAVASAKEVRTSLEKNKNMIAIGEAGMDLEEALENLPNLSFEDKGYAIRALASEKITFTNINPTLQSAARDEVKSFLKGKTSLLSKTILEPITEEKPDKEKETTFKITRPSSSPISNSKHVTQLRDATRHQEK